MALQGTCTDRVTTPHRNGGGRVADAYQDIAVAIPGVHEKNLEDHKSDNIKGFNAGVRHIGVSPHVVHDTPTIGNSEINNCTILQESYTKTIKACRGIEKVFSWMMH